MFERIHGHAGFLLSSFECQTKNIFDPPTHAGGMIGHALVWMVHRGVAGIASSHVASAVHNKRPTLTPLPFGRKQMSE